MTESARKEINGKRPERRQNRHSGFVFLQEQALTNFVNGGCATHLVAHNQQRSTLRSLFSRDKENTFGAKVSGGPGRGTSIVNAIFNRIIEVPVIEVLNVFRAGRVADVINHQPTRTLQPDERIGVPVDLRGFNRFGFRPFGVTAAIATVFIIVVIKIGTQEVGGNHFEFVAAVGNQLSRTTPDAKTARAIGQRLVQLTVAISVCSQCRQ